MTLILNAYFITTLSCSKFFLKRSGGDVSKITVIIISTINYHFKKTLQHHKGH